MREAAEALGVGGAGAPLFVEFTGLLTWLGPRGGEPGASLGWHDDAGGPHLAQRHVSCVLYLSAAGTDFGARTHGAIPVAATRSRNGCVAPGGGEFLCEPPGGGPARSFSPEAGTLLVYASSLRHAVAAVTWGERRTLALWLTRDGAHDEDAALLRGPLCAGGAGLRAASGDAAAEESAAPPDAFFCDVADGGADARLRHLADRGLRAVATAGGLHLERCADGTCLPPRFRDATHALRAAAFAEWARGAALAALGDDDAAEAAAAAEVHEAAGRAVVAQLLPRWRAANALFGPS